MRRRVVVTGVGWVTPLGNEVEDVWRRLCAGESGVGTTTLFETAGFPTTISAEVKNWDIARTGHDPVRWRNAGRHAQFMIAAGSQAMHDSGISDRSFDPQRFGIYLGSGEGNCDFGTFCQLIADSMQSEQIDLDRYTRLRSHNSTPRLKRSKNRT